MGSWEEGSGVGRECSRGRWRGSDVGGEGSGEGGDYKRDSSVKQVVWL